MRERVDLKSPVRENRPSGSVRGAPGDRRPYRDITKCSPSAQIMPDGRTNAEFFPVAYVRLVSRLGIFPFEIGRASEILV